MNSKKLLRRAFVLLLITLLLTGCGPSQFPDATVTPLPTLTPIPPTSTSTPAPPTATSVPSTPGLEILVGPGYEDYGWFHVVGEITNSTDNWFTSVTIHAAFYDINGNLLESDDSAFTTIILDPIPPKNKTPFILSSDVGGAVSSVASYQILGVEGSKSNSAPYQGLEIVGESETESYGYYNVAGDVINSGSSNCEFTKIMGAFYDTQDKLVGVDYTYTEADILPAQESSPFELTITNKYDHYQVWVQCRPIDAETAGPSTSKYNLKCDINTQNYGFEITGETGSVRSTFNNESTGYNYDSSGQMVGTTVTLNRDLFFEDSQHNYHIEGTITVNQITNEVTYDITATSDAFGNSPQTCKKP